MKGIDIMNRMLQKKPATRSPRLESSLAKAALQVGQASATEAVSTTMHKTSARPNKRRGQKAGMFMRDCSGQGTGDREQGTLPQINWGTLIASPQPPSWKKLKLPVIIGSGVAGG